MSDYVQKNRTLRNLNEDYDITTKLQQEAEKLPGKLGGAASTLRDVGVGVVNSIFALVTILILTAFLLGSGPGWVRGLLELQPPQRRERMERTLAGMSKAVGGYVAGVLLQANDRRDPSPTSFCRSSACPSARRWRFWCFSST